MADTKGERLEALFTIVDQTLGDELVGLLKKAEIPLTLTTQGQGSAKSAIYDILGYGSPKKLVSISVQTGKMANFIIEQLDRKIDFNKPGTGIAFTVSLSSISNALAMVCKKAHLDSTIGSGNMVTASKDPYHLVVAIVNGGYAQKVMEAAKKAGATGGTSINAHGLGSKEAVKYLGITIQEEKDLVLILTKAEKKLAIMEEVTQDVGLNTPGMGICFSLPVNSALGFGAGIDGIDDLEA